MRIKDIDGETMAKDYHECEAWNYRDSRAAVGADGVQVTRVKLEAALASMTPTFYEGSFKIVFTPKSVISVGYGF